MAGGAVGGATFLRAWEASDGRLVVKVRYPADTGSGTTMDYLRYDPARGRFVGDPALWREMHCAEVFDMAEIPLGALRARCGAAASREAA